MHYLEVFNHLNFLILASLIPRRPFSLSTLNSLAPDQCTVVWHLVTLLLASSFSLIPTRVENLQWLYNLFRCPHNPHGYTSFQHATHAIHEAFPLCFVYLETQVHILFWYSCNLHGLSKSSSCSYSITIAMHVFMCIPISRLSTYLRGYVECVYGCKYFVCEPLIHFVQSIKRSHNLKASISSSHFLGCPEDIQSDNIFMFSLWVDQGLEVGNIHPGIDKSAVSLLERIYWGETRKVLSSQKT